MFFQAVISRHKLKSFTKSLTCLSRYGDEVIIRASRDALFLIATNSSKTAFCRVKLTSAFFHKYKVHIPDPSGLTSQTSSDPEDHGTMTGQLLVKALLSILKHKTVDKTVDRCELSFAACGQDIDHTVDAESDADSLETKLVIRLHCKHGVVKTHRLLLSSTDIQGPQLTPLTTQSHVTIGPRALKDILDHFPHTKGTKSDPELVWLFGIDDIKIKSMELTGDARARSLISTEIQMSADEFDSYDICDPPISIAFHLREFNATIALAESLSVALDMQFTEPASPIYIDFNTDASDSEFLFVISTTQSVYDSPAPSKRPRPINLLKRDREDDQNARNSGGSDGVARSAKKGPLSAALSQQNNSSSSQLPVSGDDPNGGNVPSASGAPEPMVDPNPLFLPGASQLSNADLNLLRSSGLGIEHMDYEEFEAMMAAEGEEVGMSTDVGNGMVGHDDGSSRGDEEQGVSSAVETRLGHSQDGRDPGDGEQGMSIAVGNENRISDDDQGGLGDGEQVMSPIVGNILRNDMDEGGPGEMEQEMDHDHQMWPTQVSVSGKGEKAFRPLFED